MDKANFNRIDLDCFYSFGIGTEISKNYLEDLDQERDKDWEFNQDQEYN